jgi:hypothetical protein
MQARSKQGLLSQITFDPEDGGSTFLRNLCKRDSTFLIVHCENLKSRDGQVVVLLTNYMEWSSP